MMPTLSHRKRTNSKIKKDQSLKNKFLKRHLIKALKGKPEEMFRKNWSKIKRYLNLLI